MPGKSGKRRQRNPSELRSEALAVNLQRTAVEVRIPPRQARLLEILAPHRGVRQETERLLKEINHPFAGWEQTLADLSRRSFGDFAYYNAAEHGPEALQIYQDIYAEVTADTDGASSVPAPLRADALAAWLRYQEKIINDSGTRLSCNAPPLLSGLQQIAELLAREPDLACAATPGLRRVGLAALQHQPHLSPEVLATLARECRTALARCYACWLQYPDPIDWLEGATEPPDAVVALGHDHLRQQLQRIEAAEPDPASGAATLRQLTETPDERQLTAAYLRAGATLAGTGTGTDARDEHDLERLHWLCRVATSPHLASVHRQALGEIRRLGLSLLQRDEGRRSELLGDLFGALDLEAVPPSRPILELMTTLGAEVLRDGDTEAAPIFIEQFLRLPFQGPEFSGFTHEWSPRVNPLHLAHVRAYLRLIEANPELGRRLISALVIRLQTDGLFIADTDLFQRDVSRLLAADIEPVYHLVKTLARQFPVYFEEIGAEGELRRVSTELDELEHRRDPLCHFLRKQCHVESNPELVRLVEAVALYWGSGELQGLERYLPPQVLEPLQQQPQLREDIGALLCACEPDPVELVHRGPEAITQCMPQDACDSTAARKLLLLAELLHLLESKYALDHDDLVQRLHELPQLHEDTILALQQALAHGDDSASLQAALDVLDALRQVVLSRTRTRASEDIYRKRHIAVGIPSMYGRYREPRFDAMGLILRTESLANLLTERLVCSRELELPTKRTLHKVLCWLQLMVRGLRLDGFAARGLSMGTSMLEQALQTEGFSVDQFLDVFRFMSRAMNYLIRVRFLDVYEADLASLGNGNGDGPDPDAAALRTGETVLRDLIARSFMPQHADRLVGRVRHALGELKEGFDSDERRLLLGYRPDRTVTCIEPHLAPHEGRFLLGYKGQMVKLLLANGLPTPPGFIITTEAFRCRGVIEGHSGLRRDLQARLRHELRALERATGRRFGDPERPLLLSVRSGAAMSMPGMMDTFLNVGLAPEAVQTLAQETSPWTAWDSYRRLLQCWGMSHGIDRDRFDCEIRTAKEADGVPKKAQLSAARMQQLAGAYGGILQQAGIHIPEDPFEQLLACIGLVQGSWDSEKARLYRQETGIAEEWGTAVLVQQMVFGNLGPDAGTGVLFTRDPRSSSPGLSLYGDFAIQSQGEDIVAGLVATHPLSDSQVSESDGSEPDPDPADTAEALSLQRRFPAIYARLESWARTLLEERGFQHQEIEFTFESPDPADLWVLQSRDMVFFTPSAVPTFVSTPELEAAKVAEGIGVGGGALYGRVVYTQQDMDRLRQEHPDDAMILLRPDTVPEDIPIILRADGLLTTLGGATCHAAVAAQALGRTCVVGCAKLRVIEQDGYSEVAGRSIRVGDFISINGSDGSVYVGAHAVNRARNREYAY